MTRFTKRYDSEYRYEIFEKKSTRMAFFNQYIFVGNDPGVPMRTVATRQAFARNLLRVALTPREESDRELLVLFATNRDEDAFAELVRRHGRMVLAAARRVTGSQQDAEDAFQAVFLVLARRANHIKQPERLANWLYGVAYRTALEARTARRRGLEHPVSAIPEPAAPGPVEDFSDLRRAIDEELARLPEKYRVAVVLCELEGVSRTDAAIRLKIPEGTLSSRLAYARKLLASRLTRRGITSTASGIAGMFAGEATVGALPYELVLLTARAATRVKSGGVVLADLVSPNVFHLTEGVMKIMLANRLRLPILAGVMVTSLITLGAIGLAQQSYPQIVQPTATNGQTKNPNNQGGKPVRDTSKVTSKGIDDEDVPYGTLPMQAVVRIEEGKLIIRKRIEVREPVARQNGNQVVTTYEFASVISGMTINDASDIAVFDMKGNRLMPKAWKEKLKVDLHVILGFDGKLPNPRELTLFKDDTLLLIFPASSPLNTVPHTPANPLFHAPTAAPQASYGSFNGATPPPSGYNTPVVQELAAPQADRQRFTPDPLNAPPSITPFVPDNGPPTTAAPQVLSPQQSRNQMVPARVPDADQPLPTPGSIPSPASTSPRGSQPVPVAPATAPLSQPTQTPPALEGTTILPSVNVPATTKPMRVRSTVPGNSPPSSLPSQPQPEPNPSTTLAIPPPTANVPGISAPMNNRPAGPGNSPPVPEPRQTPPVDESAPVAPPVINPAGSAPTTTPLPVGPGNAPQVPQPSQPPPGQGDKPVAPPATGPTTTTEEVM